MIVTKGSWMGVWMVRQGSFKEAKLFCMLYSGDTSHKLLEPIDSSKDVQVCGQE